MLKQAIVDVKFTIEAVENKQLNSQFLSQFLNMEQLFTYHILPAHLYAADGFEKY